MDPFGEPSHTGELLFPDLTDASPINPDGVSTNKRKRAQTIASVNFDKLQKVESGTSYSQTGPVGLQWYGPSASCAHDALFTSIHNITLKKKDMNYIAYSAHNPSWACLEQEFLNCHGNATCLGEGYQRVRQLLNDNSCQMFPMTGAYTALTVFTGCYLYT